MIVMLLILYFLGLMSWGKNQESGIEFKKVMINNMNCCSEKGVFFQLNLPSSTPFSLGL